MEDVDLTRGEFSFAIASPGSLGNGVESSHRAIDKREVDIDSSFDELSGNQTNRKIGVKAFSDRREYLKPMLRTH